ncbi:MAG: hypothetical protein O7J95_15105 [Planctomycetota bacterium]|nr:hypothetical protein [Planctomycetota bacterium]
MRDLVDSERVQAVLKALGEQLRSPTTVYLTGGASAVLVGWRESTIDLDLKFVPDTEAFGALPQLKEKLRVNVELVSPDQFPPALPGWEDRSPFITRIRSAEFRHFDFCSQALSKIERGFNRDLDDVREMVRRKLADPVEFARFAREMVPDLIRDPAIDPGTFLRAVDDFVRRLEGC